MGHLNALRASGMAITIFVKKGTTQRDFSRIGCSDCDFSSGAVSLDLSAANFDKANLSNARFDGTKLTAASFDSADLTGTSFEGAQVQRARFTGIADDSYAVHEFIRTGGKPGVPDFACADLSQADFTGSLFFGLIESEDPNERISGDPDLFKTNLTNANLKQIGIYALPLMRSKTGKPFENTKVNTYQAPQKWSKYRVMYLVKSGDWHFVASSPSVASSWRHLLSQLKPAAGAISLPPSMNSSITDVPEPPVATGDVHRCDKYNRSQGQ